MNSDVTIRPATLADARAIALVQVEGWRTAYVGVLPQAVLDAKDVEQRTGVW